jgi:hypothetical protein
LRRSKIALMHIPRTGGTALGSHLFHQTRADPTYFFSFFGLDSSAGANRVVVERLRKGDEDHRRLMANEHFLASRVVTGHFSRDLAAVFDEVDFQFAAVLREPVDRTISMIYKYTADLGDRCRFGEIPVPSKSREPDAYWDAIHAILTAAGPGPIPGLLPHENTVLFDGMCHMVGGSELHTYCPSADFGRVERYLPTFRFGLFERFNETVGALLAHLDLPIVLDERTNYGGGGNPVDRAGHRPFYGAPPELIGLVRARNQNDLRLYERVARAGLEAATAPV